MITEVCVDTLTGVRIARAAGADRVELCAKLSVDGLTPSPELIATARADLDGSLTRLFVLIRCRAGDFDYSADESALMAEQAAAAVDAGADGVVIGGLTARGELDLELVRALTSVVRGVRLSVAVTFHRAFDAARNQLAAYDELASLAGEHRIDRILTSGGASSAPAGAGVLAALVPRMTTGPTILAGGGIRPTNVSSLIADTGVTEVHFSGRVDGLTDAATVRATIAAARGFGSPTVE